MLRLTSGFGGKDEFPTNFYPRMFIDKFISIKYVFFAANIMLSRLNLAIILMLKFYDYFLVVLLEHDSILLVSGVYK